MLGFKFDVFEVFIFNFVVVDKDIVLYEIVVWLLMEYGVWICLLLVWYFFVKCGLMYKKRLGMWLSRYVWIFRFSVRSGLIISLILILSV